MTSPAPIGIFDSGIGGLSVLQHLQKALPNEDMLYVADSGFAPYGQRSDVEIMERCETITRFLADQGAKLIVIACNTATAVAAAPLRQRFNLPIVGIEPGLKPAINSTRNGVVGILATEGTLKSEKYDHLVNRYGDKVTVISQVCNGLADQVELGAINSAETHDMLQQYLSPIMAQQADTIALGCTHYPFLIPKIKQIVGKEVEIIDTGAAIAKQVRNQLADGLHHPIQERTGKVTLYTSGDTQQLSRSVQHVWPETEAASPLNLPHSRQA